MNIEKKKSRTRVGIIGRPNVGKSSLFNYLTGSRQAVVKDQAGVTRDLIIGDVDLWGKSFELVDTGGLTEATDVFSQLIREQVLKYLHTLDILLVIVDGRVGVVPEDREVIRMANESELPFLVVVNKIDSVQDLESAKYEFYEFGEEVIAVSIEHRHGVVDLLEWLDARVNLEVLDESQETRLAIVGKPNVGKSSFLNRMVGEDRVLVSSIAGTTVDPIDAVMEFEGRRYTLTDTAGMRRHARRTDDVEIISAFKAEDAIRGTDIVLLFVDVLQGPTEQDAKIVETALDDHKAVIMVANKADLAEEQLDAYRSTFRAQVERELHFFSDIPIAFISVKTGKGIKALFDLIDKVKQQLHIRISTSHLNDFFTHVIRQAPAPGHGTKIVKFYYLTQTNQVPPSFIAFCNFPEAVDNSYRRFISKRLKEHWNLEGIPVRIFAMKKGGRSLSQ